MRAACIVLSAFLFLSFSPVTSIRSFSWLTGNWQMQDKNVYENWQFANDSLLTAASFHYLNNGQKEVDETISLIRSESNFYYIPVVPDQNQGKPVRFKIVSYTKSSFVAENLQHDFPQRIAYQLQDSLHLLSYIEGVDQGKMRRFSFNFVRAK